MTGSQVDTLCKDWIEQNYGVVLASKYMRYSLVMPIWNDAELNEALENFRQILCILFGPDESFETTDYHEAKSKLGLPASEPRIPDAFLEIVTGIV
jgi:hypothetical protein